MSHDTVGTWQTRELMELATFLSREVGALVRKAREGEVSVHDLKSSPTDVVTKVDLAAETRLRELLAEHRPEDAVLGEEGGTTGGSSGLTWILDPIDGTVNFLYGLPEWSVSIAVEVDGQVVAAAVNVVPRGEVFTASLGNGAWLDGERLRCNTGVPLSQALIGTGFGYQPGRRAVQAEVLAHVLPKVRDVRRGGSCAADLCSVAAGRLDGFYERGPQYWDYAAGGLIATEAGAVIGGLHGKPHSPEMIICAAPGLFEELHDLLAPLNPERDA